MYSVVVTLKYYCILKQGLQYHICKQLSVQLQSLNTSLKGFDLKQNPTNLLKNELIFPPIDDGKMNHACKREIIMHFSCLSSK